VTCPESNSPSILGYNSMSADWGLESGGTITPQGFPNGDDVELCAPEVTCSFSNSVPVKSGTQTYCFGLVQSIIGDASGADDGTYLRIGDSPGNANMCATISS
jgi:hypothetical protein